MDEYLRFCARLNGIARPHVSAAMARAKERCGLEDVGARLIGNLSKGYQQRVRIHIRPFAANVGDLFSGTSKDEFHAIVRKVIDLPNAGQTRIQTALEQAVADIRSEGLCLGAGIVLVMIGGLVAALGGGLSVAWANQLPNPWQVERLNDG